MKDLAPSADPIERRLRQIAAQGDSEYDDGSGVQPGENEDKSAELADSWADEQRWRPEDGPPPRLEPGETRWEYRQRCGQVAELHLSRRGDFGTEEERRVAEANKQVAAERLWCGQERPEMQAAVSTAIEALPDPEARGSMPSSPWAFCSSTANPTPGGAPTGSSSPPQRSAVA
jgi:hypothetical protein